MTEDNKTVLETGRLPPIIDNETYFMKNVLKLIFRKWAKRAKIAVGYFFATAFDNLEEELKNIEKVQIIMGQETNRMTKKELTVGDEGLQQIRTGYSKQDVMQQVVDYINRINSEDELVRLDALIKGIVEEKIEIRVRVNENGLFHPKVYWFDCSEIRGSDITIVGSHNMSKTAQEGNEEASAVVQNTLSNEAWKEWFDKKWAQSEPFSEELITLIRLNKKYYRYKKKRRREKEKKQAEKEKELPYRYIPPIQFIKMIFRSLKKEYLLERTDVLIPFQKIDYNLCRDTIQKFGGVILADTVGLGKSFIAARLVKDYFEAGMDYLFIIPPNTMDQWLDYLSIFGVPVEKGKNIISMYKVSQSDFPDDRYNNFDVIVVDESHNFRNSDSNRWKNFRDRIKNPGADYILLTATPINNRFEDLYNQVKMFENERFKNEDLLELYDKFEQFIDEGEDNIVLLEDVKELRRKLVVRTTRRDLKRFYDDIIIPGKGKVEVVEPKISKKYYKFSGEHYETLFRKFIPEFIKNLQLPHISVLNPDAAKHLYGLYKILLYKRMESSIYSLYRSVEHIEEKNKRLASLLSEMSLEEIRDLEKKDYRKTLSEAGEIEESVIESYFEGDYGSGIEDFFQDDSDETADRTEAEMFLHAIKHDLKIIAEFKEILDNIRISEFKFHDDKLDILREFIAENRHKKILMFAEFSDTTNYLYKNLKEFEADDYIIREVTGGDKKKMYEAIQFSPSSYGKKMKSDVEEELNVEIKPPYTNLLISTKTLSEGVNLQEADIVINYDLPWNPVRIIQRVGRANRIGSSQQIEVINFLPEDNINREMELIETLQDKIDNIIEIIGAEHSILSPEEMIKIKHKEKSEAELFRQKREQVSDLKLDELEGGSEFEEESEKTKLSDLDKYLLELGEQARIRKEELEDVEIPEKTPYTVLSSEENYILLHFYALIVGENKYYEAYDIEEVPPLLNFQSPRHILLDKDINKIEEFRNEDLKEIEEKRKKAQRAVFDDDLQKAKMRLISKLKNVAKGSILTTTNPEFCRTVSQIATEIEGLSIPARFKRPLQTFRTKWFKYSDCTVQREDFIQELEELKEDLVKSSETITEREKITTNYIGFIVYDKTEK